MKDLISIIVPIYNSEKTLERCIKSITSQTYKDIEIVLVDDGSVDSSASICKQWKKIDKRIKYFYKKNSGAGDTRNFGISKSNGKYICFVDSDDEILSDFCDTLIKIKYEHNVDIVGCSNFDTLENSDNNKPRFLNYDSGLINNKNAILDILYQNKNSWGAVWNKLFSREILEKFKFPNTSSLEDYAITLKIFNEYKVYIYNKPLYIHYINEGSLSHRTFSNKMLKGFDVITEINQYFQKNSSDKDIKKGCLYFELSFYDFVCRSIYKKISPEGYNFLKQSYKKYKKDLLKIFKYGSTNSLKIILKMIIYYYYYTLKGGV